MDCMESLFRYLAPLSTCGYLPDRNWRLEYEMVAELSAEPCVRAVTLTRKLTSAALKAAAALG